jgi:hypothetical protein
VRLEILMYSMYIPVSALLFAPLRAARGDFFHKLGFSGEME